MVPEKTNIGLIFFIFICWILVLIVFILNLQKGSSQNYEKIFNDIVSKNPLTLTVTYKRLSNGKYLVGYYNADGKFETSEETYPLDLYSNQILPVDLGTITPQTNGYTISGINTPIDCAPGYAGPNCDLIPFCNSGATKEPITYSIFQSLELFYFKSNSSSDSLKTFNDDQSTHPKLWLNCNPEDQTYTISACANNQRLDENLNCVIYDRCEDLTSGYKHISPISNDDILQDSEYYTCVNGKSQKTVCQENQTFNKTDLYCMDNSQCYNKGNITIPIDANNYIQCIEDREQTINCPDGVYGPPDRLNCYAEDCNKIQYFDSNIVHVPIGYTVCDDEGRKVKRCNLTTNPIQFTTLGESIVPFELPTEMYITETQECVPCEIEKAIAKDAILELQTPNDETIKFDPVTKLPICDDGTTHYMDWFNTSKVVGGEDGKIYDISVTCSPNEADPWLTAVNYWGPSDNTIMAANYGPVEKSPTLFFTIKNDELTITALVDLPETSDPDGYMLCLNSNYKTNMKSTGFVAISDKDARKITRNKNIDQFEIKREIFSYRKVSSFDTSKEYVLCEDDTSAALMKEYNIKTMACYTKKTEPSSSLKNFWQLDPLRGIRCPYLPFIELD